MILEISIIGLAITSIYTKIVFFEVLLYLTILSFFLIWSRKLSMSKSDLSKLFERTIGSNDQKEVNFKFNNNLISFQITVVALPLWIGQWWALAAIWVLGSIIRYKALYTYFYTRK